jgi:tripartite-type tricarboxylate transporter receptor subunit TctC
MRRISLPISLLTALALSMPAPRAQADAISEFYSGKTITLVVSTTPGGGYDLYSRLLSRHISKHIPGNPTVVVQNMAGAGGLTATNHLFNVAAKDGTVMGAVQNTIPYEPYFGTKEAQFDVSKFNWLGSASKDTPLFMLWHTVPVNTVAEAKTHELKMGASGINSSPAFYARVFQSLFGMKVKLIAGYQSNTDSNLAMERGENDGNASPTYTSLKVNNSEWLQKKLVKFLFQYGDKPHPDLKGVPFAPDLLSDPNDKLALAVASASFSVSKPYLLPPGVPADRVTALRKAALDTFNNKDYRAECAKIGLDCEAYSTGEEVLQFLNRVYSGPAAIRDRLVQIYAMGK